LLKFFAGIKALLCIFVPEGKLSILKKIFLFAFFLAFVSHSVAYSQGCGNLNLQLQADIPSPCTEMTMTMRQDNTGKPYLYVANKEGGLKIYDITSLPSPKLSASISISLLDSLNVMNLTQDGNYLYLALGNSFTESQNPGMAIVDVTDPAHASVTALYKYPATTGGGGIVKVKGNYAYLGAMLHGLVILDISDKHNIKFVSQFLPDRNFPEAKPDTSKYNARGLEVENDIVYLCFDAGGFRTIDVKDKQHPKEIGRYSNPDMNGRPRAYNNIALDDSLAYIAVDYCGMEILNIVDPAEIKLMSWWNPWNCTSNPLAWFSSSGHTNEIDYNKQCKEIFLATGKSDMYVVDVSNPLSPDSCANYGGTGNNIGTWGISTYQDRIFLSYICTLGIPFASNWTGVKILTYVPCTSGVDQQRMASDEITISPVPSGTEVHILSKENLPEHIHAGVYDALGNEIKVSCSLSQKSIMLDISHLAQGVYFVRLSDNGRVISKKFIKE